MRIHDYVDEIACDLLGGVGMYENAFNGLSLHAFNEAALPQAHDIFWTLPYWVERDLDYGNWREYVAVGEDAR